MLRKFSIFIFLLYPISSICQPYKIGKGKDISSTCAAGIDCSKFSIVINKGVLYYNSTSQIIALNAGSGRHLWTYSLPKSWIASNLLTLGSQLFFTDNAYDTCAPFYAISMKTHKIIWSKNYDSCLIWSDGKQLYFQAGSRDGNGIISVNPVLGDVLWRAKGERSRFVQTMIVSNNRIYTNDRVIDVKTGKTLYWWQKNSFSQKLQLQILWWSLQDTSATTMG